jgi:hypothetical protein
MSPCRLIEGARYRASRNSLAKSRSVRRERRRECTSSTPGINLDGREEEGERRQTLGTCFRLLFLICFAADYVFVVLHWLKRQRGTTTKRNSQGDAEVSRREEEEEGTSPHEKIEKKKKQLFSFFFFFFSYSTSNDTIVGCQQMSKEQR